MALKTGVQGGQASYKPSGGGGNKGSPIDYATVANMIKQSEEKIEVKLTAIEGRIDQKLSRLNQIPTESRMIFLGLVGLASMAGIFLALLAYGGDRADSGVAVGTSVGGQLEFNRAANEETKNNVDAILKKLDRLIEEDSKKK